MHWRSAGVNPGKFPRASARDLRRISASRSSSLELRLAERGSRDSLELDMAATKDDMMVADVMVTLIMMTMVRST